MTVLACISKASVKPAEKPSNIQSCLYIPSPIRERKRERGSTYLKRQFGNPCSGIMFRGIHLCTCLNCISKSNDCWSNNSLQCTPELAVVPYVQLCAGFWFFFLKKLVNSSFNWCIPKKNIYYQLRWHNQPLLFYLILIFL